MAFQPVVKRRKTVAAVGLAAALDSEATPVRSETDGGELAKKLSQAFNVALPEAQAEAAQDQVASSSHPPWSWAIHTKVRVTSASPFSWCSPAANLERSPECSQAFATLLAAGSYHKHPAFHVPHLVDPPEFHTERGRDWVAALLSVYRELCHGRCPYFYVLRDGGYSMLFLSGRGPQCPCKERCVLVAGATAALRRSLEERGIDIDVAEPPGPSSSDEGPPDGAPRRGAGRGADGPRAALWLRGRARAHLLVQWLLQAADVSPYNSGRGGAAEQKGPPGPRPAAPRPVAPLPILLAPVAFRHSVAEALRLRNCGGSVRFVDNAESHSYDLEVEGLILPTAFHSLLQTLATTQATGFHTTVLQRHPATSSFIAANPTEAPAEGDWAGRTAPRAAPRAPLARVAHSRGTFTTSFAPA